MLAVSTRGTMWTAIIAKTHSTDKSILLSCWRLLQIDTMVANAAGRNSISQFRGTDYKNGNKSLHRAVECSVEWI